MGFPKPKARERLTVSGVVRLDDVVRETATVTDRPALSLRPFPDGLHRLLAAADDALPRRAARGAARGAGARAPTRGAPATSAPSGGDVWAEDLPQLLGVLVVQVDFVGDAVKSILNGLICFGAVEVVNEGDDRSLCHSTGLSGRRSGSQLETPINSFV